MNSYIRDFSKSATMGRRTNTAGQMRSSGGCYQAVPSQRRKNTIDEGSLSDTLRSSLRVLKEHSRELVFETRGQAMRSLVRARRLDRYTAHEHLMVLTARRLLRCEKLHMENLQPRLEFVPAEASIGPRRSSLSMILAALIGGSAPNRPETRIGAHPPCCD